MVFTELRPSFTGTGNRFAVCSDLEQAHGAVLLTEGRAPDVDHVLEQLEPDRAVNAQVGTCAGRQRAFERDVDAHRAVQRRRVDARDPALDDAVPRVDFGGLADGDVPRLRFRNPQLRLQAHRVRHADEVRALVDLRAHFDPVTKHLEDTVHGGLDLQILELADAQLIGRAAQVHFGFLRRELRLDAHPRHLEPPLLDRQPVLQLFGVRPGLLERDGRNQLVLGELLIRLEGQDGVLVVRLDARDGRLLAQELTLELRLSILKGGLGGLVRQPGVHDGLLQLGVAHLEDDRADFDLGARPKHDALDPTRGGGSHPADLFGYQRARIRGPDGSSGRA